ncbi:MAG: cation transporter [Clostridiaceae bacterium]|jgi:copper chaperone|nr:cation transporter [Clostridiaceae bacterium]
MPKIVLDVDGMACSHCENAVIKAVSALDGVKKVKSNLKKKTVTVSYGGDEKAVTEATVTAITNAGYTVVTRR